MVVAVVSTGQFFELWFFSMIFSLLYLLAVIVWFIVGSVKAIRELKEEEKLKTTLKKLV